MEENCTSWKTHLVYYAKNIKDIAQILEIWKKIANIKRIICKVLHIAWKEIAHIGRHT